jgi:hypothetical protein
MAGLARQASCGLFRYGTVGRCEAWFGRLGEVRQGKAGRGESRSGGASRGKAGLESQKGVDVEVGRNGRKAVFIFSQQVQSTC